MKAEDKLLNAAEAIVNKIPRVYHLFTHSPPQKDKMTDNDHSRLLVEKILAKITESWDKECLKMKIQIMINDAQFQKNNGQ